MRSPTLLFGVALVLLVLLLSTTVSGATEEEPTPTADNDEAVVIEENSNNNNGGGDEGDETSPTNEEGERVKVRELSSAGWSNPVDGASFEEPTRLEAREETQRPSEVKSDDDEEDDNDAEEEEDSSAPGESNGEDSTTADGKKTADDDDATKTASGGGGGADERRGARFLSRAQSLENELDELVLEVQPAVGITWPIADGDDLSKMKDKLKDISLSMGAKTGVSDARKLVAKLKKRVAKLLKFNLLSMKASVSVLENLSPENDKIQKAFGTLQKYVTTRLKRNKAASKEVLTELLYLLAVAHQVDPIPAELQKQKSVYKVPTEASPAVFRYLPPAGCALYAVFVTLIAVFWPLIVKGGIRGLFIAAAMWSKTPQLFLRQSITRRNKLISLLGNDLAVLLLVSSFISYLHTFKPSWIPAWAEAEDFDFILSNFVMSGAGFYMLLAQCSVATVLCLIARRFLF